MHIGIATLSSASCSLISSRAWREKSSRGSRPTSCTCGRRAAMPKLHLTREAIRAFALPPHGEGGSTRQVLYYDELQPGLGVRVTSGGSKVYVVEASHDGKTIRVKLGRCTDL